MNKKSQKLLLRKQKKIEERDKLIEKSKTEKLNKEEEDRLAFLKQSLKNSLPIPKTKKEV